MPVNPGTGPGPGPQPGNQLPVNPSTGTNVSTPGVTGQSNAGVGVRGDSLGLVGASVHGSVPLTEPASDGVLGTGKNGVHGQSGDAGGNGVWGEHAAEGSGVAGTSKSGDGVYGTGKNGVYGQSGDAGGNGVWGEHTAGGSGVAGTSDNGTGVYGSSKNGTAGLFLGKHIVNGNAQVNGDHTVSGTINAGKDVVLTGADCAEEFDIESSVTIDAGAVMVVVAGGALRPSAKAYDRKVAGVISGAGEYRPGLILDRKASSAGRLPIALVGKVYCKVDADHGAIEVGDLLTTSPTPGHAMKAGDPSRAFGAVLGKALRSLKSGKGMIPILVALQ